MHFISSTIKNSIIFTLIFMFKISPLQPKKEKIRLYVLCTPSHEVLRDNYFLPSMQDDYEVISKKHEQIAPNEGIYGTLEFNQEMLNKVDLLIEAIKENWDTFFIYADLDIQFFRPMETILRNLIKDNDMLVQRNRPTTSPPCPCAGFMVIKGNKKTLQLWEKIKQVMYEHPEWHDQDALTNILHKDKNPFGMSWDYLPVEFFCGGILTGKRWNPGDLLKIPDNIVLHHANWTVGIENKIKQFDYVKETVAKQKS